MKNHQRTSTVLLILMLSFFLSAFVFANEYSWKEAHAKVFENGNLEWAPQAFEYKHGDQVRYIDFESGDDNNDGMKKDSPWKHHPWDQNASGNAKQAKGAITYVFKGGVIYRGSLKATESGLASDPIRLTRDPLWGEGPAWITGSMAITGGWKPLTEANAPESMADPQKVWVKELSGITEPWCVWLRYGEEARRIHIAREPDWEVSDPNFVMSEWLTFDGPSRYKPKTEGGAPIGSATTWDDEFLKAPGRSKDFFGNDTRVWVMWSGGPFSAMGTPYDSPIKEYDPVEGRITRTIMNPPYFGLAGEGDRYYMERHPSFLDQGGEFYFESTGKTGGRLYIRLPQDENPNENIVEVALDEHRQLIDIVDQHHIDISGLQFSFLNVSDNYNFPGYPLSLRVPVAIRVVGNCSNITIRNNRFYHAAGAVIATTRKPSLAPHAEDHYGYGPFKGYEILDKIVVCDNEVLHADHAGFLIEGPDRRNVFDVDNAPELGDIRLLRNKMEHINFRPRPPLPNLSIPAIGIWGCGYYGEVAGNMINRCWGTGIWMHGGKEMDDNRDRPMIRGFVHHNKVIDSLLAANDWGAIECNTGGPIYIYNNHVGNPVGPHPFKQTIDKNSYAFKNYACNAYAYYLDGGSHKKYLFNNIAWGKSNSPDEWFRNRAPQMMVSSGLCQWFNNSFDRFLTGAVGSMGSRCSSLGNIYSDIRLDYIALGMSGDISTAFGGEDPAQTLKLGLPTIAYANNIFQGIPANQRDAYNTGVKGGGKTGISTRSIDEYRTFLKDNGAMAWQAGWEVEKSPYENAADHDFRPDETVIGDKSGVKFFVPFSLYMTVGEWDFSLNRAEPGKIIGLNYYMSEEWVTKPQYYDVPWNNLHGQNVSQENFVSGPLENWTQSVLQFDGQKTFAVMTHKEMTSDYPVSVGFYNDENGRKRTIDLALPEKKLQRKLKRDPNYQAKMDSATKIFPGEKRKSLDMDTNNFLIEVYMKADSVDGTVVSKFDGKTGYELSISGGLANLTLWSNGKSVSMLSKSPVADQNWHHLVAEIDRKASKISIYLDGKKDSEANVNLSPDVSLSNAGDFYVGKGQAGYFTGGVDFLRVSRGTLEDAFTTIEEVYAWQFTDAPFLKDFTGKLRNWSRTAPGAIDFK